MANVQINQVSRSDSYKKCSSQMSSKVRVPGGVDYVQSQSQSQNFIQDP